MFLRRLPPDVCKTYANDSDSDSDQDLSNLIPDHATVTFCAVDKFVIIQCIEMQLWSPRQYSKKFADVMHEQRLALHDEDHLSSTFINVSPALHVTCTGMWPV